MPEVTFTPTPTITGTMSADQPTALGAKIGATTDANFGALSAWTTGWESGNKVTKLSGTILTPATNFSVGATTAYLTRFGNIKVLICSINRVSGAALASGAAGNLTAATPMATFGANVPFPPLTMYAVARCSQGPMSWVTIDTSGVITLKGCAALNYTYPATWTMDFEVWWVP